MVGTREHPRNCIRYADRSGYIGFRCAAVTGAMLAGLARRSNRSLTDLLNEFVDEGIHRKTRELDQRDRQRLLPA